MKTTFSPRFLIAASAIALGIAGTALAAPPADMPGGSGAGMQHGQMMHGMHGMKGMARLHDELKLDAKQEALWQDAAKASREAMSGVRDRMRKHHEEIQALLNQPGADLRAVAKRMDEFRAEGQQLHAANRDRWLTVYDALSAEQKEKARVFFKTRFERMGQGGMRGHGRS